MEDDTSEYDNIYNNKRGLSKIQKDFADDLLKTVSIFGLFFVLDYETFYTYLNYLAILFLLIMIHFKTESWDETQIDVGCLRQLKHAATKKNCSSVVFSL